MKKPTNGSVSRSVDTVKAGQGCPSPLEIGTETPQSARPNDVLQGTVINIQRFSTHDGPGVRTTVFLKGCPNSCAWCHNPESMHRQPELQLYPDRCIGCGRCLDVCPEHAHDITEGEKVFYRERCQVCGQCVDECYAGGLVIAGAQMRVDEVMAEILADRTYYRHSSGGVTFSGGEPLGQREFLRELLRQCRENEVHTAIETSGNCPWEWLLELLPHIDLVMYDLKTLDPRLHAQYVGNDGRRIRGNLLRLSDQGMPLIVRTPVIGGVNDTMDEIAGIARFLQGIDSLLYYELLPYHPLGDSKRQSLGLPEEDRFHTPSKEEMAALADIAREFVREVRP